MKLIFSRKGFDSASGGVPSPILPDGTLISLPIPDDGSKITYRELKRHGRDLGRLVEDLTRGKIKAGDGAHLDPDVIAGETDRRPGWCPVFGQCSSTQSFLRNRGVGIGDLFIFFGLFRETEAVETDAVRFRFKPGAPRAHWIWGWLKVGDLQAVEACDPESLARFGRHPHVVARREPFPMNTLYIAADRLGIPGAFNVPGAGVFATTKPALRLTDTAESRPSRWRLPGWFHPRFGSAANRPPLSHHDNPERWSFDGPDALLSTVGRGQEFVLDADDYPESERWLADLFGG